jgi:hypothetical protein
MRCDVTVEQIQNWFDTPGSAPMPDGVKAHIKDCSTCREFIKQWNSIEVGLVSMRDQTPGMSSGFTSALSARLETVKPGSPLLYRFRSLIPPRQARMALITGSAALLVWLCYAIASAVITNYSSNPSNMASHNRLRQPGTQPPIPADIPVNGVR